MTAPDHQPARWQLVSSEVDGAAGTDAHGRVPDPAQRPQQLACRASRGAKTRRLTVANPAALSVDIEQPAVHVRVFKFGRDGDRPDRAVSGAALVPCRR